MPIFAPIIAIERRYIVRVDNFLDKDVNQSIFVFPLIFWTRKGTFTMRFSEKVQRAVVGVISTSNPGVIKKFNCRGCRLKLFGLKAIPELPMSPSHIGHLAAIALEAQSEAVRHHTSLHIFVANADQGTLETFSTRSLTSPSRLMICAAGSGAEQALAKIADAEEAWRESEFD
jgi:hypothetical protein